MEDPTRRIRPLPSRTEPRRSLRDNLGGSFASGSEEHQRHGEEHRSADAGRPAGESPDPSRDTAYSTVNNAYRLIDEYLRQGQRMAENVWLPSDKGGSDSDESFNAPGRLMRAMGDMTMAWLEVLQQSTTGLRTKVPTGPVGTAGPFQSGQTPSPDEDPEAEDVGSYSAPSHAALRVRVQCSGRVEVAVDLRDPAVAARAIATELRSFDGTGRVITGVEIRAAEPGGEPTLTILVPEAQAPGTYNGLLLAPENHQPCGTVSVCVS